MTDEQFAQWLKLQGRQTVALERIATTLVIMAGALRNGTGAMPPPNPAIQARGPLGRK